MRLTGADSYEEYLSALKRIRTRSSTLNVSKSSFKIRNAKEHPKHPHGYQMKFRAKTTTIQKSGRKFDPDMTLFDEFYEFHSKYSTLPPRTQMRRRYVEDLEYTIDYRLVNYFIYISFTLICI